VCGFCEDTITNWLAAQWPLGATSRIPGLAHVPSVAAVAGGWPWTVR